VVERVFDVLTKPTMSRHKRWSPANDAPNMRFAWLPGLSNSPMRKAKPTQRADRRLGLASAARNAGTSHAEGHDREHGGGGGHYHRIVRLDSKQQRPGPARVVDTWLMIRARAASRWELVGAPGQVSSAASSGVSSSQHVARATTSTNYRTVV
jgi:hypothetical protein